jgi:hypothetical protein
MGKTSQSGQTPPRNLLGSRRRRKARRLNYEDEALRPEWTRSTLEIPPRFFDALETTAKVEGVTLPASSSMLLQSDWRLHGEKSTAQKQTSAASESIHPEDGEVRGL